MKHAALLIPIVLLIPILLGTGIDSTTTTEANQHSMDPISLVGYDLNGRVDFRGTIVFFGFGDQTTCAYNFVVGDCRGEINSAIDRCYGYPVIKKSTVKILSNNKIAFTAINIPLNSEGGQLEITLDIEKSNGSWYYAGAVSNYGSGACIFWERTLTEEIRPHAKTADDLIKYWRTPQEEDAYQDQPPPEVD